MPKWMDGKLAAAEVYKTLEGARLGWKKAPKLVVFLVGDDGASEAYVRNKTKKCAELGFEGETRTFPASVSRDALVQAIDRANADPTVDAILIQLPLPRHLNKDEMVARISPEKDADGIHPENLGGLVLNTSAPVACTPAGILFLLDFYKVPIEGARAVVVGRSDIVGKPMALLLLHRNATVTICHTKTREIDLEIQRADIAVIAAGKPKAFVASQFNPQATVIDVGIHRVGKGLVGDVDARTFEQHQGWCTPVPGGVGPLTIAMLMRNVARAAAKRQGLLEPA